MSNRHARESAELAADSADSPNWTIIGGGRLGRGVLAPLAEDLGMSSLVVVAGENTTREEIDHLNYDRSYSIRVDEPLGLREVTGFEFVARSELDRIVASIADLRTRVVSTSVGEDRLPEVLPILAAGLRRRAAGGRSDAPAAGLVLLVCENGRGLDGAPRAASVRRSLEGMVQPHNLDELADVPPVVLDAIVPHLPDATRKVSVSRGDIWIEASDLTRELLERSPDVQLASAEEIDAIHTRKLYCLNTLHLLLSVAGSFAGEGRIDTIAGDRHLRRCWSEIADSLAFATCEPRGFSVDRELGGISTAAYAQKALERLRRPPWTGFDDVERAMRKLRRGWYLDDGRIDGPVADAGLIAHPESHPALVHALALALYSIVGSINALAQRFAFVPIEMAASVEKQGVRTAFASGLALNAGSPFTAGEECSPLIEVLARDFQALNEIRSSNSDDWPTAQLAEFLAGPISGELRALPRRAGQIRCVMFDLDEGLVATESLLYGVTRELIAERSHENLTLSHDDYAQHVGRPEQDFFDRMIRTFQISKSPSRELIKLREQRFLEAIDGVDPQVLVKPGFRHLLEFLANRNVAMAVCSNASPDRVNATLERAGIANYFARVVTPADGYAPKGSSATPSMYTDVRKLLKRERNECVVVESSLFGVATAVEAGLYTLLVVNDYTEPKRVGRTGVQVLGNAQKLQSWFMQHWNDPA